MKYEILAIFALSNLWILVPLTPMHLTFIIQRINFGRCLFDFVKRPSVKQRMFIHRKMQTEDNAIRLDKEISMHKGGFLNMREPSNFCFIQAKDIDAINTETSYQSSYESLVCTNTRK